MNGRILGHEGRALALLASLGLPLGACIQSAPVPGQELDASVPSNGADPTDAAAPPADPDAAVDPDDPLGFVPYYDLWLRSPHADTASPAFNYWNEQGEVPTNCARCHSTEGYQSYLGADGSEPGTVQTPAPTGSEIRCVACHNDEASALESVEFPSEVTVSNLGAEARCMVCHQGRASGDDVDQAIAAAQVGHDEPSDMLGFINIHYRPAAATLYAGRVRGGYQYEGEVYDVRFRHVEGFDTCVGCHDPHSTQLRFDRCVDCHRGANDLQGVRDIRMIASRNQDYSGDGDRSQGLYYEIQSLIGRLEAMILRYAQQHGTSICYGDSHPYFFVDQDDDGLCSEEEQNRDNRYTSFTPRLLRATYNFQLARKDRGAFAHNGKYLIQLLHDSLQDLNAALDAPEDLSALVRTDSGHFDGAGRAARNWDAAETVSPACSRCHGGAEGYHFFQRFGVGLEVTETANGLECSTCHSSFSPYALVEVPQTALPANASATLDGNDDLCANCHVGRASKASIDAAIGRGALSFQNVHGGPAAGVVYGSQLGIGYEYEGRSYATKLAHLGGTRCTTCHDAVASNHTFLISDAWQDRCNHCHGDFDGPREVRLTHMLDYDGDGNTQESLADEIAGMAQRLLQAMHAQSGSPALCYSSAGFPYFHNDHAGNGPLCAPQDATAANRFNDWTPALLRAAHNYQLSRQDKGAWMHNFEYMGQLLYDSIEDLAGDGQGTLRP